MWVEGLNDNIRFVILDRFCVLALLCCVVVERLVSTKFKVHVHVAVYESTLDTALLTTEVKIKCFACVQSLYVHVHVHCASVYVGLQATSKTCHMSLSHGIPISSPLMPTWYSKYFFSLISTFCILYMHIIICNN